MSAPENVIAPAKAAAPDVRAALPGDARDLIALMARDARAAMFPLSALHDGLLRAPDRPLDAPHALHGWLDGQGGFLGLSGAGYLSAFRPGGWTVGAAAAFRAHLAGRRIAGAVVADGQMAAVLAGLGLTHVPRRHEGEEPGFTLDLADLILPDVAGFALARPGDHRETVMRWRLAYLAELFALTGPEAEARAASEIAGWIAADSHRVLVRDGAPVAMSGFNARIPGAVQIGGVFTPPQARGRGLARRAVALHLAGARGEGVARAVLFAANDAAAAAYRAIGFTRHGRMGIVEFQGKSEVPPWP